MLTISTIEFDPRVDKVARSLASVGYTVDVMAPGAGPGIVETEIDAGVRHVRVPLRTTGRLFLVFQEGFRRAARRRRFDYVHANDLTTLTLAWVLARKSGARLVYDAHELWNENVELEGTDWVPMSHTTRSLAERWERFLIRDVDLLITVGPSIVLEYERRFDLARAPLLLPNYPSLRQLDRNGDVQTVRETCDLDDSHFVTLYLGGINPLRNIENVIRAHRHLPENHVFIVRGPGVEGYAPEYAALARTEGVHERVLFLPPVAPSSVVAAAAGADCGIVMLRNICKNFYLFYPNKLFEYSLAGLPVAVSNFPDVARFVEAYRCGVTFDPDSPESIAGAIRALSADREAARAMGARGRAAIIGGANWETAVEPLLAAYADLK
jgi:glycosyltransferase involved in cell wall biosynthesis